MSAEEKVLAAMVTWNRIEISVPTIESYIKTGPIHQADLHIIDNGSTDGIQKWLQNNEEDLNRNGVFCHFNNENIGTANAINSIWQNRTPTQHCMKIDSDMLWPRDGWFNEMFEVFNYTDNVGIVALKRNDLWENPEHPDPFYRTQIIKIKRKDGTSFRIERTQHAIGSCVSPNTRIWTDRGLIPIGSLDKNQPFNSWTELSDLLVQNEFGEWKEATGLYKGEPQRLLKFKTKKGYTLEVTPDHKLRTVNSEGDYVWKEAQHLKKGDFLVISDQELELPVYFDPIVEITDGFNIVYDLFVPDGHTFIGNGIVQHNCWLVKSGLINSIGALRQPGLYGFDDSLYCMRAKIAGYASVFVPDVPVIHNDKGEAAGGENAKYTRWKLDSAAIDMQGFERLRDAYQSGELDVYEPFGTEMKDRIDFSYTINQNRTTPREIERELGGSLYYD